MTTMMTKKEKRTKTKQKQTQILKKNNQPIQVFVKHLTKGLYENRDKFQEVCFLKKRSKNCGKLVQLFIENANTKCIPICDWISGTIRNLVVPQNHNGGNVIVTIDVLIVILIKGDTVVL